MLIALSPLKLCQTKKNRVIMDNCLAHNYSDNIKPIAEYLIRHYPQKFDIYVSVLDESAFSFLKEKGIKTVKFHSLKFYYIAMTSAFYITNSGGYSYLPLKKKEELV